MGDVIILRTKIAPRSTRRRATGFLENWLILLGESVMKPHWVLLLACMASSAAFASDHLGLEGELVISKEPLTDPLPDGDPVAYMTLRGKDAEKIYLGMASQQDYKNACNVDGMTARVAGNLICYKNKESSYSCSFGIRLTDGSLVLGSPC